MHQGVGRLLLNSEIRGGAIDAGASRRTAFVVAGGHVLTARHCCAAATQTDLFWLRLPAPGDEFGTVDLPMRVVDEDVALDVAVLGIDPERAARGDTWGEPAAELLARVLPLPVGLPAAAGEMVRTQGYPADARDGGLAFIGRVVDPAARLRKSRAYALQLQIDELAASIPHTPGGHSGGPVLATRTGPVDVVVGLVRAYPGDETRKYAVGGSLLATRIQDLAARFPAVREAFAQRSVEVLTSASAPAMLEAASLATLIRADAQHTQFFGRKQELDQLHRWCATDAARAAVLMTGPTGQGKTRLARHLCEQLTATGDWIAVPLRGIENGGGISAGLATAALAQRPLLLAVDYAAEYGAMQLRALVDRLCAYGLPRWRLLLIARHTGDWWDGDTTTALLPGLRAAAVEVTSDPLPLPELAAAGDDRHNAYDFILHQLRTPVTIFADEHDLTIDADPPTPPLHRPEYGSALMLHIAAICALLPESGPGAGSAARLAPIKVVDRFLDLERDHHWLYRSPSNLHHTTAQAFGNLATGEAGRYLVETAVAAANLIGAADHSQACQLIRTALGIGPRRAERITYWLRDLYPPAEASASGILHSLQPDLLGEELVTRVLRRQLDHGLPLDRLLLFTLVDACSEAQIQRMLTVLIRAAERHAWIANLLTTSSGVEAGSSNRGLLDRIPLAMDLSVVVKGLPRHNTDLLWVAAQLTQHLLRRLEQLPDRTTGSIAAPETTAERARLLNDLGIRLSDLGQHTQALTAAEEAVTICRHLAETSPDTYLPNLSIFLNNLSAHLTKVGKRAEALECAEESAQLYLRFAEGAPEMYLPGLGESLNNLAVHLAEAGQSAKALVYAQHALNIRRLLAEAAPDIYLPDLAASLNNLAADLAAVGKVTEALAPAQEAAQLYRRLAQTAPAAYLPYLAMSLNTLANQLAAVGQHTEALAPAQEAAQLHRRLAQTAPDAYLPYLAVSLNTLANQLAVVGKVTEALAPAQESVQLYRNLTQTAPDAYLPNLARSLNALAVHLAGIGKVTEALTSAQEAVQLLRDLAQTAPDAYLPILAESLNILAIQLSDLGQHTEGLAIAQEAVTIRRRLADAAPGAYLPALAESLHNLAANLAKLGQHTEALTSAQEAVQLLRLLAQTAPDAYLPGLAASLNNLAVWLSDLGQHTEGLAIAQEAVTIRRRLADAAPGAYLPALAQSLHNLAANLAKLGQHTEALTSAQEAVQLLRRLAEATPDAYLPDLATSLTNLAVYLAGVGQHTKGLAAARDATELYRRLAKAAPKTYLPKLVTSLTKLSSRLTELGQHTEALASVQEAAKLHEDLALMALDPYLTDTLSSRLAGGGHTEGLAAAREAVELYRRLAEAAPDTYLPNLATSLANLSVYLAGVGQHTEGLAAGREAVELYRRLAEAAPDAYLPNLAASLTNLSSRLTGVEQDTEALAAGREAVELYRRLAEAAPDAYLPNLAASLTTLAMRLSWVAQRTEALAAAQEAVTIRRRLAQDAHLVASLTVLALTLLAVGQKTEAMARAHEAGSIRGRLGGASPSSTSPS